MTSINTHSVIVRVFGSISSNGLKAILGFFSTILIARHLAPSGYGDLMFLFGTFVSLRPLLDLGSSNAFFTFLSEGRKAAHYYLFYFLWLAVQFFLMTSLIFIILPDAWYEKIWLNQDKLIVFLAFFAVFMQQQIWQTFVQIGEAFRQTIKVQLASLVIALSYLVVLILVTGYSSLTVKGIFLIQITQYFIAVAIFYFLTRKNRHQKFDSKKSFKEISLEYFHYCKPLILVTFAGFLYEFLDKWMLQKYSGSEQQGFFQISSQFASLSLLFTASVMNIFWREFAALWSTGGGERMARLYRIFTQGLVIISAAISGFLMPWSKEIVFFLLGNSYSGAEIILVIALLYPIHQTMGQVCGVVFLASSQTKKFMAISVAMMLSSIPLTYILLAPNSHLFYGGFDLGALGLAIKMVGLGVISVNLQSWVISKFCGWKYEWLWQLYGIALFVSAGFFFKATLNAIFDVNPHDKYSLIIPVMFYSILYLIYSISIFFIFPGIFGLTRSIQINCFRAAHKYLKYKRLFF